MLKFLRKLFRKEKRIAFIDGDQELMPLLNAYTKYVAGTNTETHFVRFGKYTGEPKAFQKTPEINKIYLQGFTKGKEVVDKYIGAFIQKSINEGYNHITVISSDYDFVDIFKMAVILDERAEELTFKLIVPRPRGPRFAELPAQVANIEIVKVKK